VKNYLPASGFDLIELTIVSAIIAIPAAVAIRQYFRSIKAARAQTVTGNFRILVAAANGRRACNT
jgi:type II secretory pathway pseudopilin PulG